jgi:acetyl esterase/lipase
MRCFIFLSGQGCGLLAPLPLPLPLPTPAQAQAASRPFTEVPNVPYAVERHPRLVGDLYLPEPRLDSPAALLIHGGSWISLDKSSLARISELMASRGFVVYSINYRRLPEAPWPACYDDCVSAFEALRTPSFQSRYGFHAEQLVVAGASAGGHLALMTGLSRPRGEVAAILSFAGPAFLAVNAKTSDPVLFTPAFFDRFFGSRAAVTPAALAAASPLQLVVRGSPPLWLIQSRNDRLVPPVHAQSLARRYADAANDVHVHFFNGRDSVHGLWVDNAAPQRVLAPAARAALEQSLSEIRDDLALSRQPRSNPTP